MAASNGMVIPVFGGSGAGSESQCYINVTEADDGAIAGKAVRLSHNGGKLYEVSVPSTVHAVHFKIAEVGSYTVRTALSANGLNSTFYKETTVNITSLSEIYDIVQPVLFDSWSDASDDTIAGMVKAADDGLIKLTDYWAVGQERKVNLSAMSATGVGESHVAQAVTLVLLNAGGKTLDSGKECNFVAGLKNGLKEYGYMNASDTNANGWDGCARRTWCNNVFKAAIPSTLVSIFKQFKNQTATGSSSTAKASTDYFALASEKEVFGSATYANSTAENGNSQFEYYKAAANRIKRNGDDGSAYVWWERSPFSGSSNSFCFVTSDGGARGNAASNANLISPFGCI